jgi:hypothetical protein
MTSAISISGLDSNYPTPGVNNSSQGFRDNFTNIKNNLDTAATEITDLQNKALVKSAIPGVTMDNNMGNGIIYNVQTLAFKSSMFSLGNNLSVNLTIDCARGDVHTGTLTGNIDNLVFENWALANTRGSVEVILNVVSGQTITLPPAVTLGLDTIEGRTGLTITVPYGVTRLHYMFSTTDCGATVEIVPIDRPRQANQITYATAPAVANVSGSGTITNNTSNVLLTGTGTSFLTELVVGRVIVSGGNTIGTIANIGSATSANFTTVPTTAVTTAAYTLVNVPVGNTGDKQGDIKTDGTYLYICTSNYSSTSVIPAWKRIVLSAY